MTFTCGCHPKRTGLICIDIGSNDKASHAKYKQASELEGTNGSNL